MATYTNATDRGAVFGEQGNDVIDGDKGNNQIYAGNGINIVSTRQGNDTIFAGAGKDFISAGDGNNTVYAGGGSDRVLSGTGDDLIFLANGKNLAYSGKGNDTIYASSGNSTISAGQGNDKLFLGGGNNRVILDAGQGAVTITGFNPATDRLRLGESLMGKSLTFVTQGLDTLVRSGDDLLATLKNTSGSSASIDNTPLYTYTATDLGSLRTDTKSVESVNAGSINDFGQIVGRYNTGETFTNQNTATPPVTNTNNAVRQGFIWENGVFKALTSTGVKNGDSDFGAKNGETIKLLTPTVNTIDNLGKILGTADEVRQPVGLPTDRALVWEQDSEGYKLTINDFGGKESYFFDTNNSNTIVGRNILSSGYEKTIYSDKGTIKELAALGGDGGTARGINNPGQIVGFVDTDGKLDDTFVNTAVIWEKDGKGDYQLTNLGTFEAAQATLRDINDSGQIIGATSNGLSGTSAVSSPFILCDANGDGKYALSELTQLGSLGGKTGSVNGINSFGQVVGTSADKDGKNRAFVWADGKITDLNSLVSAPITYDGAAVTLTSGVGINNFGDITALGTYTYKDTANKEQTGTRSYLLSGLLGDTKSAAAPLDAKEIAQISGNSSNSASNLNTMVAKSLSSTPDITTSGLTLAASSQPLAIETPLQSSVGYGMGDARSLNAGSSLIATEPTSIVPQPLFAATNSLLPLPA